MWCIDATVAMALSLVLFFSLFTLSFAAQNTSFDELWKVYKAQHMKVYHTKYEGARRLIWENNALLVAKHNLEADFGLHSYRLEINKFSDMTESELDSYRKCVQHSEDFKTSRRYYSCDENCFRSLPINIDWRTKNYVTAVKDQGDCGSCWAFSSTGALEGQTKAKTGVLVTLSEQNLVDCSWKQGNMGCNGGWMDYAFEYVIQNDGIDTEKTYPYKAKDKNCKFVRNGVGANCSDYVHIHQGSEKDLQAAVANIGPIAVAIDASGDKFMNYREGIYYDKTCTSTELDHAVLVVGYGSKNGKDYWIVKNSWGTSWGMDGYILMAQNAHNMCGIASHALYPVV